MIEFWAAITMLLQYFFNDYVDDNKPQPTVDFSNEFLCEQLRAGATVEAVVEWERSEGVALDQAYPNVETAVYEVCPEFEILLQDYKQSQGE